jgi:peptide/nickel transport system substrate-binding protein
LKTSARSPIAPNLPAAGLLIALLLALTACQALPTPTAPPPSSQPLATTEPTPSPTAPPVEPTATPTPAPPPSGDSLTLGFIGPPPTGNPLLDHTPAAAQLAPLLYASLLRVEPRTGRLQPGLAQRWEYSADGKQVTFHLPEDMHWSDGSPLTAADIVAGWEATQHPALLKFSHITAPAAHTLTLTFTAIDCAAVTGLALLPLIPAGQVSQPRPPGSGPFRPAAVQPDDRALALERNPYYSGPPPLAGQITVRWIDPATADVVLSEGFGQFDLLGPFPGAVAVPEGMAEVVSPAAQMVYLAMNHVPKNTPPLPVELHQALVLALDRPAILAEALGDDGQLLAGSLLPGHWAAAELPLPEYRPDEARKLLAQAGLRDTNGDGWLEWDGKRLELSLRLNGQNRLSQRVGWLVSSYYRDLGLFARADSVPPDSVIDDLFTHDFNLAVFNWPIPADPDQRLFWRSDENKEGEGLNFTSYSNPALDELMTAGVAVPGCRVEERAPIYAEVQYTLHQERPVDFLLTPNRHVVVSPRLAGLEVGPFAPLTWNVETWHVQTP